MPLDETLGRRRLTESERKELLELPVPGVFSTIGGEGRIHSVPVHFLREGDELRFVAERDSVKYRNVERTGRATMCVVATIDEERQYVTAEGRVRSEDRIRAEDLIDLERRYGLDLPSPDDEDYANSVTLALVPESWIAWADFED